MHNFVTNSVFELLRAGTHVPSPCLASQVPQSVWACLVILLYFDHCVCIFTVFHAVCICFQYGMPTLGL